jgi:hypothetical protein
MPWFRVEDSFHQHPKVLRAGNAAIGLWVRCGTWSAQYLTDGFIPANIAATYGRPREIRQLVTARLWSEQEGGFVMCDYLEYNPSASDVKQRRKEDAERKRRGRNSTSKDDPFK